MDVKPLLQLAFPRAGETLDNLASPVHRKAFKEFQKKVDERGVIRLSDLITFGSRSDSPSLYLSEDAQQKLLQLTTVKCRQATVEAIRRSLARSLSLMGNYGWCSRIYFEKNGAVTLCAAQDYDVDMREVRAGLSGK